MRRDVVRQRGGAWAAGVLAALCLGCTAGVAHSLTLIEQAHTPSSMRAASSPADVKAGEATVANVRRVVLHRVPSFSPYVRLVYAWTKQGSWWISTSEGLWPPPWPKTTASELREGAEIAKVLRAALAATEDAVRVRCVEGTPALRRGQAVLALEWQGEEGPQEACYSVEENLESGRFSADLETLYTQAPAIEASDRWSHPFWLQDESAVLRVELQGTADVEIDDVALGRINGVVNLRLPVGRRELRFVPSNGAETRTEVVVLRRDQVTVLRLSVEARANDRAPSWEQPSGAKR